MRKTTFLAAILSFVFAQAICAAESNEPDANSFRSQSPRTRGMYRSERVMINWHDGIQQMVVSPRLTPDTNSLWIFPLKCESEQVKFSLTKNFPHFYGADCREIARNVLANVNYAVIATQLWTIPLCYFGAESSDYSFSPGISGVVDSNGVHIELLKADSVPALAQQLKERGRSIQETELGTYAKYLNKEYSLLAVWREGNEPNTTQSDFRHSYRRRPCIYVEFPSEKPFYLMANESGRQRRLLLTLTGFWQIAGQEQSNAFRNQQVSQDANVPDSFRSSLPQKNIPFTTFSLSGEGNRMQNDLTFVPGRLKGIAYADAVTKMSYLELIPLGLIALAGISYLSAGVSGLLTYRKWRGFAEFGFLNLLSIIAMGIVMNYKKGGISEIFRQNKWKARIFLAFFSVIAVLLSFALFAMLKIPLKLQ
jgi:hypothetical protein